MVVRLLTARARFLNVSFSILLAELEAVVLSLTLTADFDLSRVIIESDAKGTIDYICDEKECLNEIEEVVKIPNNNEKEEELVLDGGFSVPYINLFGHSFWSNSSLP
ncbi:hypothetical protein LguiB_032700 [Lonicera macranthoides]